MSKIYISPCLNNALQLTHSPLVQRQNVLLHTNHYHRQQTFHVSLLLCDHCCRELHCSLLEDARFTVYEDEREMIVAYVSACALQR